MNYGIVEYSHYKQYALNNPLLYTDPTGNYVAPFDNGKFGLGGGANHDFDDNTDLYGNPIMAPGGYIADFRSFSAGNFSSGPGFEDLWTYRSDIGSWVKNSDLSTYYGQAEADAGWIFDSFIIGSSGPNSNYLNGIFLRKAGQYKGVYFSDIRSSFSHDLERDWGEFTTSLLGLTLGAAEILFGSVAEVGSGGLSTAVSAALVIDGAARVGSNYMKILEVGRLNSIKAKATPSNLGGWIGKGIDMMNGGTYNDIGLGQGVGAFSNDFLTFIFMGGNAYNVARLVNNFSAYNFVTYTTVLGGVPITVVSDGINYSFFKGN